MSVKDPIAITENVPMNSCHCGGPNREAEYMLEVAVFGPAVCMILWFATTRMDRLISGDRMGTESTNPNEGSVRCVHCGSADVQVTVVAEQDLGREVVAVIAAERGTTVKALRHKLPLNTCMRCGAQWAPGMSMTIDAIAEHLAVEAARVEEEKARVKEEKARADEQRRKEDRKRDIGLVLFGMVLLVAVGLVCGVVYLVRLL